MIDRGPYIAGRKWDLTYQTALQLGTIDAGTATGQGGRRAVTLRRKTGLALLLVAAVGLARTRLGPGRRRRPSARGS